jgi:hypothetical protein
LAKKSKTKAKAKGKPAKKAAPKAAPRKAKPAKIAKPAKTQLNIRSKPAPAKAPVPAAPSPMLRKSRIPPRLTIRSPVGADELKAKIGALATQTAQIRALKRSLSRSFYDVGNILVDIRDRKLYEAKGYGSFEAFVEREIELGKQMSLKLVRIVGTFIREAALSIGLDRASAGIAAIDGETETQAQPQPPTAPTTPGIARSPIPFHKQ